MNEKVKQVFKKLCENYVRDINQLEGKKIAQDYFYNDKYEVEYHINGEWVATADILKAFDNMEELIKGKDEYIAKLCCDRAELKEHEKELIAEQHRLFDLAKEQETELKKLKENYAKLEINCANKLQDNNLIVHIAVDDLRECQNANKKLLEENQKLNQKPQFPNTNLWDNQELDELQKFAKLISEKRVDMSLFRDYDLDIYEYNTDYVEDEFRLTQNEFDLIKKVVEKYGK